MAFDEPLKNFFMYIDENLYNKYAHARIHIYRNLSYIKMLT